jgi:hypothetical protein
MGSQWDKARECAGGSKSKRTQQVAHKKLAGPVIPVGGAEELVAEASAPSKNGETNSRERSGRAGMDAAGPQMWRTREGGAGGTARELAGRWTEEAVHRG